ncbi:MAG: hypothetical protein AAF934_01705, partial [Bacteroidota bacterium]
LSCSLFKFEIRTTTIRANLKWFYYYLVAYLNSRYGQLQLERISSGSILQSIRSNDLKKVDVILPPVEIQDGIGYKIKEAVYSQAEVRKNIDEAKRGISGLI